MPPGHEMVRTQFPLEEADTELVFTPIINWEESWCEGCTYLKPDLVQVLEEVLDAGSYGGVKEMRGRGIASRSLSTGRNWSMRVT